MLSYRHAFHAGNHADVLKHFVLMQVLSYTTQKDKPFWYIDTHAGAGMYSLDTGFAAQNAEYETGIAKLWQANDLPAELANYVALLKRLISHPIQKQPNSIYILAHPFAHKRYCVMMIACAYLSCIRVILRFCERTLEVISAASEST